MKDNSKCFVRLSNDIYQEITYGELKERRRKYIKYRRKRFIKVDDILLEVPKEEYIRMQREEQRQKYLDRLERKLKILSLDKEDGKGIMLKEKVVDIDCDIESEVDKKLKIQKLYDALSQLNKQEYELIKALFYEQKSLREYAKEQGIPHTNIHYKKELILKELKKILKNS